MELAIVSGSAPGRAANTTMVGISTLGSGEIGRKRYATIPDSSSPSESRMVATGRAMKGAEKPISYSAATGFASGPATASRNRSSAR